MFFCALKIILLSTLFLRIKLFAFPWNNDFFIEPNLYNILFVLLKFIVVLPIFGFTLVIWELVFFVVWLLSLYLRIFELLIILFLFFSSIGSKFVFSLVFIKGKLSLLLKDFFLLQLTDKWFIFFVRYFTLIINSFLFYIYSAYNHFIYIFFY